MISNSLLLRLSQKFILISNSLRSKLFTSVLDQFHCLFYPFNQKLMNERRYKNKESSVKIVKYAKLPWELWASPRYSMLNPTTRSPIFQQMILSRVVFLVTLVACIHGLVVPNDGDDMAILTDDRREHRRHHPAEAPPATTTATSTTSTTTTTTTTAATTTPKPNFADCMFAQLYFYLNSHDNHSSPRTTDLAKFGLMGYLSLSCTDLARIRIHSSLSK